MVTSGNAQCATIPQLNTCNAIYFVACTRDFRAQRPQILSACAKTCPILIQENVAGNDGLLRKIVGNFCDDPAEIAAFDEAEMKLNVEVCEKHGNRMSIHDKKKALCSTIHRYRAIVEKLYKYE